MQWITRSIEDTQHIAHDLVMSLAPRKTARVLALRGNLGVGKTTFTQCVARELGITEHVTSPTFVIEKIYELKDQVFRRLIHIDAYRLENGHELEVLGWKSIVSDPDNLIIVEWPENVSEIISPDAVTIEFEYIDETTRMITIHNNG